MESILTIPKSKKGFPKSWPEEARAQLESSGISYAMAEALGIRYLTHEEIADLPDAPPNGGRSDGLYFPYAGTKDHYRVRFLRDNRSTAQIKVGKPDKPAKYAQPGKSANQLYVPPDAILNRPFANIMADAAVPLVLVEGEKTDVKLMQTGILAVGMGGVRSWQLKGGIPLPALVAMKLEGRTVVIIFDSGQRQLS